MKIFKASIAVFLWGTRAFAAGPEVSQTNLFDNVNQVVPDGTADGMADFHSITSDIAHITSLKVRLKISGNFNGDTYAYLTHGSGLAVLLNRPGRTAAQGRGYSDFGFDITLDDLAPTDIHNYRLVLTPSPGSPLTGAWQPDARFADPFLVTQSFPRTAFLNDFLGLKAEGLWTLFLADMDSGGTNLLASWALELTGSTFVIPSISWTDPAAIVYGTALTTNQLNAIVNVPGVLSYNPPPGTVLPVGNHQPLLVTFSPDDPSEYRPATTTVYLDVTPASLSLSASDHARRYGANNPTFAGNLVGVQNNDNITANYSTEASAPSPVGHYPIVPTFNDPDGKLANYTVSTTNGTLTVNPALLIGTVSDQHRPYGETNRPFSVTYSGFVNGEDPVIVSGTLQINSLAETNSPVGPYPITVSGQSAPNYTVEYVEGTLWVDPALLVVTAEDASRAYSHTNPPFSASITGFVNGEDTNVLQGTLLLSTPADIHSPVGAYPIEPSGLSATNYTIGFSNGTLNVTAVALSADAGDGVRVYGATNPPFAGNLVGVQNDDNITATYIADASAASPVGHYPIVPTFNDPDGKLANYIVSVTNGTLTVNPALLIGTATDQYRPYGQTNPPFTVTYSGFVNGEGPPIVSGALEGSSTAQTNSPLGPYPIVVSGQTAPNYTIEYLEGTLWVTNAITLGGITSSANPALPGAMITFKVTLTGLYPGGGLPGGTVQFKIDGAAYGPPVTLVAGLGTLSTASLSRGQHSVSAEYGGDGNFLGITNSLESLQNISALPPTLSLLTNSQGGFKVVVSGMAWGIYFVQYTEHLGEATWGLLEAGTADSMGRLELDDPLSPGTSARFYRAVSPSEVGTNLFYRKIVSSSNPALPGTPVTFTAHVIPTDSHGNDNPATNAVQFEVDGLSYGDPVPLVGGYARTSSSTLAPGTHVITLQYGSGSVLWPTIPMDQPQIINSPPIAAEGLVIRNSNGGTKLLVSELMANASDPDGDVPALDSLGLRSAAGATIGLADGWIYYTPPVGFTNADSFTYTVKDRFGASATGIVRVAILALNQPSPDQTRLDLGDGTYRILFSGIPWRHYTIEYAQGTNSNWQFLAVGIADSHGRLQIDGSLAEGADTRLYRLVSALDNVSASPFRFAVWTNFIAQTNGRTTEMWSLRSHPEDWPNSPPVFQWNTNCLLYGLKGFTAISQCNQFEGAPGQVPVTLLTKRHAYLRGHGTGSNGLFTNSLAGQKVWFCTETNTIVTMTVAAHAVRTAGVGGNGFDYGIVVFTEDVPDSITPLEVMSASDFAIYYYNTEDIPFLWFGTEQNGHYAAAVGGSPMFEYPLFKGGDSGSPNMIPSPDNRLIFFSGRQSSGPTPAMQADIDALSILVGINPNAYRLQAYDLSPWE